MDWKPITELRSVTFHMGSHSVTCHPTQVKAPCLNPSHTGRYSIYLPWRDGRLSWPWWLVIYRDDLPVRRVTRPSSNHSIATRPGVEPTTFQLWVQRPNRYATKPPAKWHLNPSNGFSRWHERDRRQTKDRTRYREMCRNRRISFRLIMLMKQSHTKHHSFSRTYLIVLTARRRDQKWSV